MGGFKMHHDALFTVVSNIVHAHSIRILVAVRFFDRTWFIWASDGQTTGDSYSNRGHFGYKWEDGRIAELHGYWSEDVQNTQAAAYACGQRERMIFSELGARIKNPTGHEGPASWQGFFGRKIREQEFTKPG